MTCTTEKHVQKRLTLINPTKLELALCLSFKKGYLKKFILDCPVEPQLWLKVKGQIKKNKIVEMYNTELMFSRVMYLLSANQIDLEDVFNYELAPFPTSIFGQSREPGSQN